MKNNNRKSTDSVESCCQSVHFGCATKRPSYRIEVSTMHCRMILCFCCCNVFGGTFICRCVYLMRLLSPAAWNYYCRGNTLYSVANREHAANTRKYYTLIDQILTLEHARTCMHACAVPVYNKLLILAMSHDAGFWHSYATVFALFCFVFSRSFCSFCVSFVYEQLHLCLYKVHTWHAVGSVCGHFLVHSNVATSLSNVLPFFSRALFVLLFGFSYSL